MNTIRKGLCMRVYCVFKVFVQQPMRDQQRSWNSSQAHTMFTQGSPHVVNVSSYRKEPMLAHGKIASAVTSFFQTPVVNFQMLLLDAECPETHHQGIG